jgi:hypothetical protein
MEYSKFVRKPFVVEAIEVTEDNIAELAGMIGTLREKENGTPYIAVDRRLMPNLLRVYPGFWVTRMGDNVRCYSRRIFRQQFVQLDDDLESWITFLNSQEKESARIDE